MARILMIIIVALTVGVAGVEAQTEGKATFYGKGATGARTASGVRFHNDSLFCAHRKYPFGTMLLVRNPANGKEVVVKVVDRGPFGKGKIIDLSYEAARRIGIISKGVAMVEVSEVKEHTGVPYPAEDYAIPELDLEVNTTADSIPAWQKNSRKK